MAPFPNLVSTAIRWLAGGASRVRRRRASVHLSSGAPPLWLASARSWARPAPILLIAALALAARRRGVARAGVDAQTAMAEALTSRGLVCDATDVEWISGTRGLWKALTGNSRALVRAHAVDEPSDLFLVEARLSPEGDVLDVGDAWNITETTGADESRPIVRGHLAVYTTMVDGLCTGLHVLDLDGRALNAHGDFTRLQQAQIALTNLQHTGQRTGVVHNTFALDPVARIATTAWREDGLVEVHADGRVIVVDPLHSNVVSGGSFVRVILDERARPGNLATWAVDRVRALPWFGDDRMQWVKAVAFTALDRWNVQFSRGSTAQDIQDELGLAEASAGAPTFTDPEIGWPPPPMKTIASPPLQGEGQWIALDKDPFITPTPSGIAPAFVTSFVRPNAHRLDVRVYVTLWDPRQIALHVEAGTVEPITASGEHGPGLVPRTPEVIKRLVAGFNGGFQPQHGEYGVQANGIEYLPPKPYAATVVELRDGSNAFGAWPAPGHEAEVPDDVIAFRQNLTALVQDGKFNPWGRTWWGGTPPGWPDQIHSTRSAVCLTRDGFIAYFYSTSIAADDLAQGMLAGRCTFGIHLDMNPGHAGFEFYNVAPDNQLRPLQRPLQSDWEAEGKVAEMPGYVFRSRRMIRGMGHMLFPRYIQREARDFFYLTERPILPGAPIDPGPGVEADERVWRTKGLPQHGFPYALATTVVRADGPSGLRLSVLRADPRTLKPATAAGPPEPPVLSLTAGARGTLSLWWYGGVFSIGPTAPGSDATALAGGVPPTSSLAAAARAAVGVQDEDGMLVWIELPPDTPVVGTQTAKAMDAWLSRLGCSARMSLPGDARALIGGSVELSGNSVAEAMPPIGARLVRAHAPDAHTIFEGTPIVPIQVWQPLQAKRVRYFVNPTPSPSSASSSSGTPPQTTTEKSATTAPSATVRFLNRLRSTH
ncbi:MAG: hypothetical protein M3O46_17770 [Myxococcota bacterium]|nr:hypothetical protein [Myxococcota bacterium]